MGLLMMDSKGWPYYSFDCLLFERMWSDQTEFCAQFHGHSGQCDMTDSKHSSLHPLAIREMGKVVFTVCGES